MQNYYIAMNVPQKPLLTIGPLTQPTNRRLGGIARNRRPGNGPPLTA